MCFKCRLMSCDRRLEVVPAALAIWMYYDLAHCLRKKEKQQFSFFLSSEPRSIFGCCITLVRSIRAVKSQRGGQGTKTEQRRKRRGIRPYLHIHFDISIFSAVEQDFNFFPFLPFAWSSPLYPQDRGWLYKVVVIQTRSCRVRQIVMVELFVLQGKWVWRHHLSFLSKASTEILTGVRQT